MTETISLRCWLDEKPPQANVIKTPIDFINSRLSKLIIKPFEEINKIVPDTSLLGSFLMKHEMKKIGSLNQMISSEEFNKIITSSDPHMTVAITWKAIVSDNNSSQRIAYGQHFIQLRNLYET